MMEYKIVKKPQFTVMGVSGKFHPDTSYQEIPKYWTEMMGKPDFPLMGMYGPPVRSGPWRELCGALAPGGKGIKKKSRNWHANSGICIAINKTRRA